MSDFDYNESFEFLASRFFDETGFIAPGKSVAPEMAYCENDDEKRRELWNDFMVRRSREAWALWHEKHGYLAITVADEHSPTMDERYDTFTSGILLDGNNVGCTITGNVINGCKVEGEGQ